MSSRKTAISVPRCVERSRWRKWRSSMGPAQHVLMNRQLPSLDGLGWVRWGCVYVWKGWKGFSSEYRTWRTRSRTAIEQWTRKDTLDRMVPKLWMNEFWNWIELYGQKLCENCTHAIGIPEFLGCLMGWFGEVFGGGSNRSVVRMWWFCSLGLWQGRVRGIEGMLTAFFPHKLFIRHCIDCILCGCCWT